MVLGIMGNSPINNFSLSNHDFTLLTVLHGWVFGLGMTKNSSNNIEFEYN